MNQSYADERDMIDREASAWLVRMEEHGLDHDAQREFDAWRTADPRHATTYDEMRQTWGSISELDELAELVPMPRAKSKLWLEPFHHRRIVIAGAATLAAALVAFFALPGHLFGNGKHYATQLAETRIITLPDGSSVTLGAKSSIAVKFDERERRIVLAGGEAFFDVVHNTTRPFFVEAGNSIVKDIGTKFDVNLGEGSVRISVLEGLVEVTRTNTPIGNQSRFLQAGERTEVSFADAVPGTGASSPPQPIPTFPAQAPGAWREGRLVFDNVRLADLAADVNRYYGPGVTLKSVKVGDLRVTTAFKTSEIRTFMRVLSATLPVQAVEASDGAFGIGPAQR